MGVAVVAVVDRASECFFFCCFVSLSLDETHSGRRRICFFSTQGEITSRTLPRTTGEKEQLMQARRRESWGPKNAARPRSLAAISINKRPSKKKQSLSLSRSYLVRHDVFRAEGLAGLLEAGLGAGVGVVAHFLSLLFEGGEAEIGRRSCEKQSCHRRKEEKKNLNLEEKHLLLFHPRLFLSFVFFFSGSIFFLHKKSIRRKSSDQMQKSLAAALPLT